MIFRQFFDDTSWTYSYLIADPLAKEAVIIDPVLERTDHYIRAIRELNLTLVYAIDTHIHADHITGSGQLKQATDCTTAIGSHAQVDCIDLKISEGLPIRFGKLQLSPIYTPGHTDDSYSFVMNDRVFTGDTLMIRSTGRTDFQNGDPGQQYDSIFKKLLTLPDHYLIYPAHDYNGWTVSSIGEEKAHNPRLKVRSRTEYIDQMNNLKLANPKLMDVAVPANRKCGMI
ncbi:MBL fold metallo-hydrolase [bacterium]|nr:MBL fold metallo-hydrolase [bacterium]